MAETQDTIWLTQDAFDKLSAELADLKDNGRPAVAKKIADARAEGDLSENGGYHAAREEQGQMEGRIAQLEQMLRVAKVGEPQADTGTVSVGSQVRVAYFDDEDDSEAFLLGSREMLGLDQSVDTQVYSPQSPLGAAVLGHSVGDKVSYQAPTGKTIEVTVLDVRPFTG
jgi:transcription elongation factor GreA